MGDHTEQCLEEASEIVIVKLEGYFEMLRFAAFPLEHTLILGKQLLASYQTNRDCITSKVFIKHQNVGKTRNKLAPREEGPFRVVTLDSNTVSYMPVGLKDRV